MTVVSQLLIGAAGASAVMALLWVVQWLRRDAGVVDVGWAASLAILAIWYAASAANEPTIRRWLIAALAASWGFRLALYLLRDRVWRKSHEDGRYLALRAYWGTSAQPWFFLFFQAQALLAALFSVPFLIAMRAHGTLDVWDGVGIGIWAVAVGGEALADRQLAEFRSNPANGGRTCRAGLWAWSRHPNYFFEWCHWWAWVCFAAGSPWWWATLAAPALMLLFLFRLTGIPYTEAQALRSRGEDYRRYQQEVSPFVPWYPRQAVRQEVGR